jgi:hypothetical protein
VGEFEGEVGVGVRRHAAWEHGTAHCYTAGPGHGNLLVLLVARRELGACHTSLPMRLELLRSLSVSLRRSQFSPRPGTITDAFHGRVVPRPLKAAAVYTLFVLFSGP